MKPFYLSKTLIVNTLTLIILILLSLAGSPILSEYSEALTAIVAILNIVLRFITKEPIHV